MTVIFILKLLLKKFKVKFFNIHVFHCYFFKKNVGLIALFSYLLLIVWFCTLFFLVILHPIFLPTFWFCTPSVFNCTFAPYLFVYCVILHPLFYFLSDFAPHLLSLFPSFNDDFEQNTIDKRWGAKSHKKKEEMQNRTISKR